MANETEDRSTHVIHDKERIGQVIIADEVFTNVAALAAMEVDGVVSIANNVTRDQLARQGRRSAGKGVKVNIRGEEVEVYLAVHLHFGYSIPETAAKIQEKVQSSIENMIGYTVKQVNIKIAGVVVEK